MKREGITRAVARMAREDKRLKAEAALRGVRACCCNRKARTAQKHRKALPIWTNHFRFDRLGSRIRLAS